MMLIVKKREKILGIFSLMIVWVLYKNIEHNIFAFKLEISIDFLGNNIMKYLQQFFSLYQMNSTQCH
jgi:hypothetical protein